MKVLLLKDYFSPENCAGINLTNDLLEAIAKSGNEAEVFTPIPCRGINDEIRKEYRYKKRKFYMMVKLLFTDIGFLMKRKILFLEHYVICYKMLFKL